VILVGKHSSGGFLFLEQVNSRRLNHSSGVFFTIELMIPGRITLNAMLPQTAIFAVTGRRVWQLALQEILRAVDVPGFIILKSSLPSKPIISKLKSENGIKIKNKPYPALVRTS
jgi:hypothetical protein